MCQFMIDGDASTRIFVAPLTPLALNGRHPAAREAAKAIAPRRRKFKAISTAKIENLINELSKYYTIAIVTHNMEQAARVSKFVAFMDLGELVEFGETGQVFTNPKEKRTQDYITGIFG